MHILRERLAPFGFNQSLIFGDQGLQIIGRKFGIEIESAIFLGDFQRLFKRAMIEFEHDIGIHLDEPAIAVPRKARVARRGCEALYGNVVKPQIQNGIHHPGHRHPRAGADRDEQRIGGVAEGLAGHVLNMRDAVGDFSADAVGEGLAVRIISAAHLGRDREAGRHRQANRGHAVKIGTLAAKDILVAANGLVPVRNAATETIYILGHSLSPPDLSHRERCETWPLAA